MSIAWSWIGFELSSESGGALGPATLELILRPAVSRAVHVETLEAVSPRIGKEDRILEMRSVAPIMRLAVVLDALLVADSPAPLQRSHPIWSALQRIGATESACFALVPHDIDSIEFVVGPHALKTLQTALAAIRALPMT